jgi:hypothetical protein
MLLRAVAVRNNRLKTSAIISGDIEADSSAHGPRLACFAPERNLKSGLLCKAWTTSQVPPIPSTAKPIGKTQHDADRRAIMALTPMIDNGSCLSFVRLVCDPVADILLICIL